MAFFGVTIETIKTIEPIEGADRIQKATLDGPTFQFVIAKDAFAVGEKVLYFPIDSIIPEELAKTLGVFGKLAGKAKDRVKTVKLRGVLSQGVIGPIKIIDSLEDKTPEKITEFLNVKKYEPPAILEKGANLRQLPCGLNVYDIEGCERNMDIVDLLKLKLCYITEKVEGSNFSITYDGTKVWVNQRRHTIEQIEGEALHTWWKVAIESGMVEAVKDLYARNQNIVATIYGEMVGPGIQGNIYKLPSHKVFVFDIKIGDCWMSAYPFKQNVARYGLTPAPEIATVELGSFLSSYKSIVEASHGKSLIYPGTLREGIVIKPVFEEIVEKFGRLIIKQRDPIYLSGNEN